MTTADIVSQLEDLVETATQSVLLLVGDAKREQSGRPFGWTEPDVWTRLEMYLDVRDNPVHWQQTLAEQAALYGQPYAEAQLVRDLTEMERLLDAHGGRDAVLARQMMQRLGTARRTVSDARELLEAPPIEVRPAFAPPADPLVGVMQQAGQQPAAPVFGYQQPPQLPPPVQMPAQDIGLTSFGPTLQPLLR